MKIGVLALQGAFDEHIKMLEGLGISSAEIRLPDQLADLDGLIIPGGESTAIAKLAVAYDFIDPLKNFAASKALWGTCAGMIFMAKEVKGEGVDQPVLGLMDIVVARNAFGRQVDSFEIDLNVADLPGGEKTPFPAVFIRAPKLISVGSDARVLASLPDGTPVAACQNKWLATAFHPELSRDNRFHRFFAEMARSQG
jgi:pyridoxal 5'-phosphate synthase pdxT subunit